MSGFYYSGELQEKILSCLLKNTSFLLQCKTCSEPKQITSSSAIYNNPNLIKPIPVKPSENQHQRISQQSKVKYFVCFLTSAAVIQEPCRNIYLSQKVSARI